MVLTDEELTRAEEQVLSLLQELPAPASPLLVINRLKDENLAEPLIRAAIWYLIDRNAVQLTWDRRLKPARTFDVPGALSGR